MLSLALHHAATLGVCVALGVATAWWMFRGDRGKPPATPPAQSDEGDQT